MYKYELHMHTSDGSLCGKSTGAEMAEYYIAHGYSGAVVSNHFYHGNTSPSRDLPWQDYVSEYARGYYSFRETVGNRDFDCFFGVEERLDGWDEYIFLGLEPEWYAAHPELRDMKGAEYLDTVRAHGGFVIHAHGIDSIGSGFRGDLAGQHIVSGIAVGDLDHLALLAFALNVL